MIVADEIKVKPMEEMGVIGLKETGGYINEEFLIKLQGQRGAQIFKEMSENDAIIGSVIFAIDMLIRQVDWKVQEASQDPADIEVADFVTSCMEDMSHTWKDMISEILSMLVFGYSWHEIVYKRRLGQSNNPTRRSKFDDGKIGWRKIPTRAQETLYRWHFDDDGGLKAFEQWDDYHGKQAIIPIEKSLHFTTRKRKNNPEGRSILRTAYRSYYFKKNIENIEGIGIERDLAGLPIIWVPPQYLSEKASADEKAALAKMQKLATSIKRDEQEGLVMPLAYDESGNKLFDIQLLNSGGSRQFNTSEIIRRYDQSMAMSVLADFILLGHEKVGSFALASSKTEMFSTAMGAWMDGISDVFNRHAIPRLVRMNNFSVKQFPKITHGDIESQDLGELGTYIQTISGAGATLFPDEKLENHLRKQAGLPLTDTDSESL